MAINPKKLLPPSKTGEIVKSLGSNLTTVSKNIRLPQSNFLDLSPTTNNEEIGEEKTLEIFSEETQNNVSLIRVKVIKIEDILKGTIAAEKKALDDKKREESTKRREKEEEKLENQSKKETGGIKVPSIPRMGFFDRIKNFITNVILGYFAVRLIDHLPKIIPVLKFLGQATDFVLNYGGKLLDGLVTFIDWGYKAQDKTKGFLKDLGGENFVKVFDAFNGAIGTLIDTAITAAIVVATQGKGGVLDVGMDMLTNRFAGKGAQQAAQSGARSAGQAGLRALPPAGGTATATAVGKQGTKSILKTVKPLLKRLPIIGALIDFGLSVALGESPGRAAFKAIGAGLLGSVGAAIGSVVPIAGNIVGGIVGGMAGDAVGGALYDMFFDNKKPQQKPQKIQKKAGGGITRGGETLGSVKREIGGTKKKGKYKRTVPKKPGKVEINEGADVGGKEKILGIFPKPSLPDVVNPFKVVKTAGEDLGKTDYFGPILAITSKITLGQKPTPQDYQNVGLGINMLISKGVQDGQLKGGIVAAFAEGGLVDPDVLSAVETGGDISNWVAKTFKGEIESNAQKTLRLIRENAQKKKMDQEGPLKDDPTLGIEDQLLPGGLTEGQWGPLLDLIAGKESGGNYEAMYPSTRLPGATKMTISEVARRATGAVGKYQQLPQYLIGRAKAAGLNPDKDLYSPENQEKIIVNVNIKGRGGQRWLKGEISDEEFMQGLSQEFASLPNAQGKFHYSGQRSSMTPDKVKNALSKVKRGGYSQEEISTYSRDSIQLGRGYGSAGSKIAGELGRFMKKKGVVPGSIHRHPEHPPYSLTSGHSKGSLHYQGRAIDLGAYAHEQGPILAAIAEFNRLKGVKPVQLLHARNEPSGHSDHVHVAYFHGKNFGIVPFDGFTLRLHKGEVFKVIDKDSVGLLGYDLTKEIIDIENQSQLVAKAPSIIEKLKTISGYASYEEGSPETIIIPTPVSSIQDDYQAPTPSSGGMMISLGGSIDPYETLYAGG